VVPETATVVHFFYLSGTAFAAPKYLLWTLAFLKNYEHYDVAPMKFRKTNPRTFFDSVWSVLDLLGREMDEVNNHFFFFFFSLSTTNFRFHFRFIVVCVWMFCVLFFFFVLLFVCCVKCVCKLTFVDCVCL